MTPSVQIPGWRPGVLAPAAALALLLAGGSPATGQSLLGSSASLDRQNAQAAAHGFSYLETPNDVTRFVRSGYLVPVVPNADMDLHQISFPYTRPEVRVFIQRLASQYRASCGEKLVVTSLTRPNSNQPANASTRSVHPTGMAVDLRRSNRASCRQWLESTLLYLEGEGLVEATRERNPPHYHLAVFPRPYSGYLASITGREAESLADASAARVEWVSHRVGRGETLTSIANHYGSSVSRLRAENGLGSDRLLVGQTLRVPTLERVADSGDSGAAVVEVQDAAGAGARDAEPARHTVGRGESLWLIARRYGVDEVEIRRANGLTSNRIYVGQDLSIPGTSGMAGASAATHTVARGESLWTIARTYGIEEDVIRAVNGLRGSRILVGQTLTIPSRGVSDAILQYTVARGESLWTIANRHGTTVDDIRRTNGMDTTRIYAGQVLDVPVGF